jgi:hypothetical protein
MVSGLSLLKNGILHWPRLGNGTNGVGREDETEDRGSNEHRAVCGCDRWIGLAVHTNSQKETAESFLIYEGLPSGCTRPILSLFMTRF